MSTNTVSLSQLVTSSTSTTTLAPPAVTGVSADAQAATFTQSPSAASASTLAVGASGTGSYGFTIAEFMARETGLSAQWTNDATRPAALNLVAGIDDGTATLTKLTVSKQGAVDFGIRALATAAADFAKISMVYVYNSIGEVVATIDPTKNTKLTTVLNADDYYIEAIGVAGAKAVFDVGASKAKVAGSTRATAYDLGALNANNDHYGAADPVTGLLTKYDANGQIIMDLASGLPQLFDPAANIGTTAAWNQNVSFSSYLSPTSPDVYKVSPLNTGTVEILMTTTISGVTSSLTDAAGNRITANDDGTYNVDAGQDYFISVSGAGSGAYSIDVGFAMKFGTAGDSNSPFSVNVLTGGTTTQLGYFGGTGLAGANSPLYYQFDLPNTANGTSAEFANVKINLNMNAGTYSPAQAWAAGVPAGSGTKVQVEVWKAGADGLFSSATRVADSYSGPVGTTTAGVTSGKMASGFNGYANYNTWLLTGSNVANTATYGQPLSLGTGRYFVKIYNYGLMPGVTVDMLTNMYNGVKPTITADYNVKDTIAGVFDTSQSTVAGVLGTPAASANLGSVVENKGGFYQVNTITQATVGSGKQNIAEFVGSVGKPTGTVVVGAGGVNAVNTPDIADYYTITADTAATIKVNVSELLGQVTASDTEDTTTKIRVMLFEDMGTSTALKLVATQDFGKGDVYVATFNGTTTTYGAPTGTATLSYTIPGTSAAPGKKFYVVVAATDGATIGKTAFAVSAGVNLNGLISAATQQGAAATALKPALYKLAVSADRVNDATLDAGGNWAANTTTQPYSIASSGFVVNSIPDFVGAAVDLGALTTSGFAVPTLSATKLQFLDATLDGLDLAKFTVGTAGLFQAQIAAATQGTGAFSYRAALWKLDGDGLATPFTMTLVSDQLNAGGFQNYLAAGTYLLGMAATAGSFDYALNATLGRTPLFGTPGAETVLNAPSATTFPATAGASPVTNPSVSFLANSPTAFSLNIPQQAMAYLDISKVSPTNTPATITGRLLRVNGTNLEELQTLTFTNYPATSSTSSRAVLMLPKSSSSDGFAGGEVFLELTSPTAIANKVVLTVLRTDVADSNLNTINGGAALTVNTALSGAATANSTIDRVIYVGGFKTGLSGNQVIVADPGIQQTYMVTLASNMQLSVGALDAVGQPNIEILTKLGSVYTPVAFVNGSVALGTEVRANLTIGTYYIRVTSTQGTSATLHVEGKPLPVDAGLDGTGLYKTIGTANVPAFSLSGGADVRGWINGNLDGLDYQKISVAAGTDFVLAANMLELTSDADLYLLDSAGNLLYRQAPDANGYSKVTTVSAGSSGAVQSVTDGTLQESINKVILEGGVSGNTYYLLAKARGVTMTATNGADLTGGGAPSGISGGFVYDPTPLAPNSGDEANYLGRGKAIDTFYTLYITKDKILSDSPTLDLGATGDVTGSGTTWTANAKDVVMSGTPAALGVQPATIDLTGISFTGTGNAQLQPGVGQQIIRNWLGATNTQDLYHFHLEQSRDVVLSLGGKDGTALKGDLDITLLTFNATTGEFKTIATAAHTGTMNESLRIAVAKGDYYVRVSRKFGQTSVYDMSLSAIPISDGGSSYVTAGVIGNLATKVDGNTKNLVQAGRYVGPADSQHYYRFTLSSATTFAAYVANGGSFNADGSFTNGSGPVAFDSTAGVAAKLFRIIKLGDGTESIQAVNVTPTTSGTTGMVTLAPTANLDPGDYVIQVVRTKGATLFDLKINAIDHLAGGSVGSALALGSTVDGSALDISRTDYLMMSNPAAYYTFKAERAGDLQVLFNNVVFEGAINPPAGATFNGQAVSSANGNLEAWAMQYVKYVIQSVPASGTSTQPIFLTSVPGQNQSVTVADHFVSVANASALNANIYGMGTGFDKGTWAVGVMLDIPMIGSPAYPAFSLPKVRFQIQVEQSPVVTIGNSFGAATPLGDLVTATDAKTSRNWVSQTRSTGISANDADMYYFNLSKTTTITAKLTGLSAEADLVLYRVISRDPLNGNAVTETTIVAESNNPDGKDQIINTDALPVGEYFLQVKSVVGATFYNLAVSGGAVPKTVVGGTFQTAYSVPSTLIKASSTSLLQVLNMTQEWVGAANPAEVFKINLTPLTLVAPPTGGAADTRQVNFQINYTGEAVAPIIEIYSGVLNLKKTVDLATIVGGTTVTLGKNTAAVNKSFSLKLTDLGTDVAADPNIYIKVLARDGSKASYYDLKMALSAIPAGTVVPPINNGGGTTPINIDPSKLGLGSAGSPYNGPGAGVLYHDWKIPDADPNPDLSKIDGIVAASSSSGLNGMLKDKFGDGIIDRKDIIAILAALSETGGGGMTADKLADLKRLCDKTAGDTLMMADYVRVLLRKLVLGDKSNSAPGNAGTPPGDLTATSTQAQMLALVDKWFYGTPTLQTAFDPRPAGETYKAFKGSLFVDQAPRGDAGTGERPADKNTGAGNALRRLATDAAHPNLADVDWYDVNQGGLGDCYLIASMGILGLKRPEAVKSAFLDNGDGTVTVRLFRPNWNVANMSGAWSPANRGVVAEYVTVSKEFPMSGAGPKYVMRDWNRPDNANQEIWPMLFEKAYVQMAASGWCRHQSNNSYGPIAGGTSEIVVYMAGTNLAWGLPDIDTAIARARDPFDVTWTCFNAGKYGAVGNHAESLIDFVDDPSGDKTKGLFIIKNPWGSTHCQLTYDQYKEIGNLTMTNASLTDTSTWLVKNLWAG